MAIPKDLVIISQDTNFQNRVLYALVTAALAVLAELSSTQGHVQRVGYANKILNGNANVQNVALGVLTNITIAGEADATKTSNGDYAIPDGDIQFAVNTFFSAFSGVAN